jgi:hypothetical protein
MSGWAVGASLNRQPFNSSFLLEKTCRSGVSSPVAVAWRFSCSPVVDTKSLQHV